MKPLLAASFVGTLLRAVPMLDVDPLCARDECAYLLIAERLVESGEVLGATDPQHQMFWLWAPLYPYALAATEWLTGDAEWFKAIQILLFPVLAWCGWRLAGRGREGNIAAWLLALSPTLVFFSGRIWSETLYVVALFGLLVALGWARKGGPLRGLAPGVLVGLSVLMRGVATYMLPVLILGRMWGRWRDTRAWASSLVMVLGAAAVVAPWSAVASAEHGGFVLSDRSLGQMMWLGNNEFDPVSFDYGMNPADRHTGRPHCDAELGVLAWDACEVDAGKQWIRDNPGEFVERIPMRIAQLYNPNSLLTRALRQDELPVRRFTEDALALLVVVFSGLAVFGGAVGGVARGRGWLLVTVAGLTAYQIAAVSLVAGLSRYRVPIDALWLLGAALFLARPLETFTALRSTWRGPALAVLLVLLTPFFGRYLLTSYGVIGVPTTLPAGGDKPDLVLISVDTLRADHLGAWGYERDTSPHLDALAARGQRFANARSPSPWTLPSHATMLTGLLPHEHGAVDDGMQLADVPRLPEVLGEQGYVTGGFVTSLFVGAQFGMDRGFDHFDDFGIRTKAANLKDEVQAEEVVDSALLWVEEHLGESVFLFVHLYDAHYPYDAPYPYDSRFDEAGNDIEYRKYFYYLRRPLSEQQMSHQVAQYDEEIAYVDEQLGRLFEAFEDRDVVFVVTADHGEEFGERGSWGHGHTLYPEQLHVPLIVSGHGVDAGVVEQAVGSQDIAPTMAALGGAHIEGVNLLESPPSGRALISDTSRFKTNRVGVYQDGMRLDWDLVNEQKTLYADPLELTPVDQPEDTEALTALLAQHLGTPWATDEPVAITQGVALSEGVASDVGMGAFALIPVDASAGDFSVANPPAEGDSLQFYGLGQEAIVLDPEQRAALEALGYIQ